MGANSGIEWTDHTFNPWTGCQKVSPACDHCYAETQAKRAPKTFGGWGPGAERKRTSESYWRQPLLWNKRAAKEGRRYRVFCASMADVFDNAVPDQWREDLWRLILDTPNLDWLLLTKRPQNIGKMLPPAWKGGWPNVWFGTTVENQAEADRRIPSLLAVPATKRFLSMEPLLGRVDLNRIRGGAEQWTDALSGLTYYGPGSAPIGPRIHWVIAGGESGPKARPSHPDWARSLRDQCQAANVPFFWKQWGEFLPEYDRDRDDPDWRRCDVWNAKPGRWINLAGGHGFHGDRVHYAHRVGKKAAGAMLDGREWREVPDA